MEGLRIELGKYALNYANEKLRPISSGRQAFTDSGRVYVDIAFDEPNLFRYLYMGVDSGQFTDILGFDEIITERKNAFLVEQVATHFNVSKEKAGTFCKNMIIYTHGLACLVAAGLITDTKLEIYKMMKVAAEGFLLQMNAC